MHAFLHALSVMDLSVILFIACVLVQVTMLSNAATVAFAFPVTFAVAVAVPVAVVVGVIIVIVVIIAVNRQRPPIQLIVVCCG